MGQTTFKSQYCLGNLGGGVDKFWIFFFSSKIYTLSLAFNDNIHLVVCKETVDLGRGTGSGILKVSTLSPRENN